MEAEEDPAVRRAMDPDLNVSVNENEVQTVKLRLEPPFILTLWTAVLLSIWTANSILVVQILWKILDNLP